MSRRQAEYENLNDLTDDQWDDFCEEIANGRAPNDLLKAYDVRRTSFTLWLDEHPNKAADFKRARKLRAEAHAEELITTGTQQLDKDDVPSARLAVDTLKWAAEKADPETYGKQPEVITNFAALHLTVVQDFNAKVKADRLRNVATPTLGPAPAPNDSLVPTADLDLTHLLAND